MPRSYPKIADLKRALGIEQSRQGRRSSRTTEGYTNTQRSMNEYLCAMFCGITFEGREDIFIFPARASELSAMIDSIPHSNVRLGAFLCRFQTLSTTLSYFRSHSWNSQMTSCRSCFHECSVLIRISFTRSKQMTTRNRFIITRLMILLNFVMTLSSNPCGPSIFVTSAFFFVQGALPDH